MAFCANCGTEVQDSNKFCPSCGREVSAAPTNAGQQSVPVNDAEENKLMAVLSYIIFFIPLLTGDHRKSPFVKFHANQGAVMFITAIIWGVAYGIITGILTAIFFNPYTISGGGLGVLGIITTILGLVWLVIPALNIYGIINAVTGKTKELPVIGKFKIIK